MSYPEGFRRIILTIQPPGNIVRSGEQQDERRQRADSKWVSGEQQIMWNIKYVNISFEVWGGILSFIIMFCTMLRGNVRDELKWPFNRLALCNGIMLLTDAAAWGFKGSLNELNRVIVIASNFLTFVFGYFMLAAFTDYLVRYLQVKGFVKIKLNRVVLGLCMAGVIMVIVSQFTHMYYIIDENNMYRRQDYFWVSQIWGVMCMVINAYILIRYRAYMGNGERLVFSSYIILPVLSMGIQIFVYGLALLNKATTVSLVMVYIGIQMEQARILKEKELELSESRIAIMLSQIQPHFLYNTLTAIGCLCDIDSSRAKKAIIDFSEYLRGNLDSLSRTALIPFEKELSHISIYLSLEKMRFEEELTVQYELTVKNFLLPPLTVQPLVENAVRHGISKKEDGGIIIIATKDTGKYIEITVTDNGAGFDMDKLDKEDRVHVGLQNVRKRLQIQCGGSLKVESSPGNGTRVTLAIPYDHPQVS